MVTHPSKRFMRTPPHYAYDWFAPLRSSDVVAGKITNFEFMGQELIAFRDDAGRVSVLDAHCPHFGAHRGVGGRMVDGCVRCPFHGLHFDGNGQCVKGDFVTDPRGLRHVRSVPWTVHEVAASIFIWHGEDRQRPSRPLELAEPGFFDGWSEPVTNAGRRLATTNLFFPTENVIDLQHFYAVHHWQVNGILEHPTERADGTFGAVMDVTWIAGAQSSNALVRRLASVYRSAFRFDIAIHGPGLAVSVSTLTPKQGGLELMNIILITPVNATDCHIRVVSCMKHHFDGRLSRWAKRLSGVGPEDLLSRFFLTVATKDFDGDAEIWARRRFLTNPKPLPDDGPIVAFRRWTEQFWPADYLPDSARQEAVVAEH